MEARAEERDTRGLTSMRLFVVAEALRRGFSPQKIYSITKMDIWFLDGFKRIPGCC